MKFFSARGGPGPSDTKSEHCELLVKIICLLSQTRFSLIMKSKFGACRFSNALFSGNDFEGRKVFISGNVIVL